MPDLIDPRSPEYLATLAMAENWKAVVDTYRRATGKDVPDAIALAEVRRMIVQAASRPNDVVSAASAYLDLVAEFPQSEETARAGLARAIENYRERVERVVLAFRKEKP
jgi:hypothetical protein